MSVVSDESDDPIAVRTANSLGGALIAAIREASPDSEAMASVTAGAISGLVAVILDLGADLEVSRGLIHHTVDQFCDQLIPQIRLMRGEVLDA